jgi:hypothetical protein
MITAFIERLATGNTKSVEAFRTHIFRNSLLRCVLCSFCALCQQGVLITRHVTSFTAGRKTNEIWGSHGSGHGTHCRPVCDAVYVCFSAAVSMSQTVQRSMIGELERIWKEVVEAPPRYWPEDTGGTYVKTACLGKDSNPAPPEFKSSALPFHQPLRSRRYTVIRTLPSYGRFEGTSCRHLEGTGGGRAAKRVYT